MAEICASQSRDIVSALIIKSFSARSVAEQRLIYEQNRPPPKLGLQCRGRKFRAEWYEKKDWLCGSEGKQGLFCWPCLLFRPGLSATWTVTGYRNVQGLLSDCKKHEASKSHMGAYKTWKTFHIDETERVDTLFSRARREEIEHHNEEVIKNQRSSNRSTRIVTNERILIGSNF